MAKQKTKTPTMTPDQEHFAEARFMTLEGLVQWTQAVITQSARVSEADARQCSPPLHPDLTRTWQQRAEEHRQAVHTFHSECHFFAIAAYKLLEYRKWVPTFGLCAAVDFGEVDQFSEQNIKDVRDMREHVIEYFAGAGNFRERWITETGGVSS
jgi:hypothetical protein